MVGNKGQGALNTVITVIIVAFFLIVGVIIFGFMHSELRTSSTWENLVVNETLTNVSSLPAERTTANYPIVPNTTYAEKVYVRNATDEALLTRATHYEVEELGKEDGNVTITALPTGYFAAANLQPLITYKYYGGEGYKALEKTASQTYSGFKLGALIPYILFAVAIIVIVLGAFAMKRI